jgi:hypothetical protein
MLRWHCPEDRVAPAQPAVLIDVVEVERVCSSPRVVVI